MFTARGFIKLYESIKYCSNSHVKLFLLSEHKYFQVLSIFTFPGIPPPQNLQVRRSDTTRGVSESHEKRLGKFVFYLRIDDRGDAVVE